MNVTAWMLQNNIALFHAYIDNCLIHHEYKYWYQNEVFIVIILCMCHSEPSRRDSWNTFKLYSEKILLLCIHDLHNIADQHIFYTLI